MPPNTNPPTQPSITIKLTLHPGGGMAIEGPTHERLLFLGMLALAADEVNHLHREQSKRIVTPPADLKVIR